MNTFEIDVDDLTAHVTEHGLRGAITWLSRRTQYRFTSLCLIDNQQLKVISQLDRLQSNDNDHGHDVCPTAYCDVVLASNQPLAIADALHDLRVAHHPSKQFVRAYCGFPIRHSDGSACGTISHFDSQPRVLVTADRDMLDVASKLLSEALSRISPLQ